MCIESVYKRWAEIAEIGIDQLDGCSGEYTKVSYTMPGWSEVIV